MSPNPVQPQPVISIPSETNFRHQKTRLLLRMLVISSLVVFSVETLLMFLLDYVLDIPEPLWLVLDGLVLISVLFPFHYYLIVRPVLRQIEQHQRTNQELVKSAEVVERFFSINGVMIAYMDAAFNFIRVNQAYAESDGRDTSFFPGKNHFDLFPNAENLQIFSNVVATGIPYNIAAKPFEYAEHPERGVSYWDWSLLPIKAPGGKVEALLLVLSDVTERVRAQRNLIESERRFRGVFNQTYQHIGLLTPQGEVMVFNQTALDFTGQTAEALAGKALWQLPWWVEVSETLDLLREAVRQAAEGHVVRREQRLRSGRGELTYVDITIKPLLDENGAARLLIYEARDITPHIRAEEALRRSEAEINRLYQAEMRAHQLADVLHEAVLALSRTLKVDTVMETLLDHMYQVVPYSSAHILVFDAEDQLLVRAARGEEDWHEDESMRERRLEMGEVAVLSELFHDRKVVYIPDTLLYPGTTFLPIDQFVRSWVGIPMMVGDQVIGACLLEHRCADFFTENLIHWATALASQAGVALQNAWLFEQVQDGREHLQALSRRLVIAQESERHYIARELHDEAGQALASLMVGLRLLERDGGDRAAVQARSAELKQIADGVLENLHRLAMDLRPATLDHLGLVAALRQHAETISDQHGLVVQFETVGRIERLPGEMETAVYRIVQEALTNVVRHAHATRVDILIERRNESLFVIVEDNGIGFDPQVTREDCLGMLGMQERADMLGGVIKIESKPGSGTTIMMEVSCLFEY